MESLLIFPCNGNGLEALDCLGDAFRVLGFVDDDPTKQGQQHYGHTVYSRAKLAEHPEAKVLAVPGSPTSYLQRAELIASLNLSPERLTRVIHPSASVSSLAEVGLNTLVMAGAVITSNARVGDHVCVLPNSVIHHDASVGDYTLIGSGVTISGRTRVGRNCYVGSGSHLINGIEVGDRALIGLGSNVVRSLPEGCKAYGNPARPKGAP